MKAVHPRQTKPEDIDPERKRGSTRPEPPSPLIRRSLAPVPPAPVPDSKWMVPFSWMLGAILAGMLVTGLVMAEWAQKKAETLNEQWKKSGTVATAGAQGIVDSLNTQLGKASADLKSVTAELTTKQRDLAKAKSDLKLAESARNTAINAQATAERKLVRVREAAKKHGLFEGADEKAEALAKIRKALEPE